MNINISEIYPRAQAAARKGAKPGNDYGMEDIAPEAVIEAIASSPTMSQFLVEATFEGCVDALLERGTGFNQVKVATVSLPSDMLVTDADIQLARSWLATALENNVSDKERSKMVFEDMTGRGWGGDAYRVTSLVLALVAIAQSA